MTPIIARHAMHFLNTIKINPNMLNCFNLKICVLNSIQLYLTHVNKSLIYFMVFDIQ